MKELTDDSLMPFGKHRGEKLSEVPAQYLLWIWDNGIYADPAIGMHHYIKEAFSALETEARDYIVQHRPSK